MNSELYDTVRILTSVPVFLAVWALLITAAGPVYGILLCWIPAMLAGWIVGWLWPVIAIGALSFVAIFTVSIF